MTRFATKHGLNSNTSTNNEKWGHPFGPMVIM